MFSVLTSAFSLTGSLCHPVYFHSAFINTFLRSPKTVPSAYGAQMSFRSLEQSPRTTQHVPQLRAGQTGLRISSTRSPAHNGAGAHVTVFGMDESDLHSNRPFQYICHF